MREPRGNGRQLTLALVAFTVTFYGWALLGPLGPELQEDLGLSDVQLSIAVAVPVLLGSLMRIPMGVLAERFGGRRVFTWLLAFSILPLLALALVHDSFAAIIAWAFWAVFPFSRLVHMLSIPLQYLGRPYILYRRRFHPTSTRTR